MLARIVAIAALLLLATAGAVAGEVEAIFSTPDGQPTLRVSVSNPRGEITREFFDSIDIRASIRVTDGAARRVRLVPEFIGGAPLEKLQTSAALGETDGRTGEWSVDWSGTSIVIQNLKAAGLTAEALQFAGDIRRGDFTNLLFEDYRATVASLFVRRGNADLHAIDPVSGTRLASHRISAKNHRRAAETLAQQADGFDPAPMAYQIEGVARKKTRYVLVVSGFDAE